MQKPEVELSILQKKRRQVLTQGIVVTTESLEASLRRLITMLKVGETNPIVHKARCRHVKEHLHELIDLVFMEA